jgi:hypothetical protein
MGLSDRDIDALLAQGRLSGPEADRILEHVLDRTARGGTTRRLWWPLTAGFGLAAATAALLLIGPMAQREGEGFTPRGGAAGATGLPATDLDVACLGASLTACPRGSTLLFAVQSGAPAGYLAAWAEPAGGGERVWYFSADGEAPAVARSTAGTQPLSRGVRVGPEHAAGSYVVHVVLSEQPLTKAALLGPNPPGVVALHTLALDVVEPPRP